MSGWLIPESKVVRSVAERFAHILSAIGTVQEQLHGISEEELAKDRMRRLALERLLEIVSTASNHIPASLKAAENGVDWQAIADIGDRLENTRDRIEPHVLWTVSQDKLMPLKVCAELNSYRQPSRPKSPAPAHKFRNFRIFS
jgi:uncharacterized protein with HEPN domain